MIPDKTFALRDSGSRTEFCTGSVRDVVDGKGRFDLIPYYPLLRLAQWYEKGIAKYGLRNWELGQPLHGYVNSALRHLAKAAAGWTDEDHWSAAVWNIFAYVATKQWVDEGLLPSNLDDVGVLKVVEK